MASGDLDCPVILFRAITRAKDFDKVTRQLKAVAFHRRGGDKKGLSVNYNCHPKECGAELNGRQGIASLLTGRVRLLDGVDVVPDNDHHANITGVPMRDENLERAEQIAGDLAEQARIKLMHEL